MSTLRYSLSYQGYTVHERALYFKTTFFHKIKITHFPHRTLHIFSKRHPFFCVQKTHTHIHPPIIFSSKNPHKRRSHSHLTSSRQYVAILPPIHPPLFMYDYDAHRRVGLKGANPGLHSGVHSHNSPLSQASSSLLTQPSPELLYRYGGVGGGGGGGGRVGLGGQQTPQTAPAPLLPADSAAAPQPQGWWWRRMLPPPQLLYVLAAVTLLIWAFPCILPLYDTVDIDLTYYRAYEGMNEERDWRWVGDIKGESDHVDSTNVDDTSGCDESG